MKDVNMTARELWNFRKIAKFAFELYVLNGGIHIIANIQEMEKLGY